MSRSYKAARKARRKNAENTKDTKFRASSTNMHVFGVSTLKDGVEVFMFRYMKYYTEIRKEGVNKEFAHQLAMLAISITKAVEGVHDRYPVQGNAQNVVNMCTEMWFAVNDPEYQEAVQSNTVDELLRRRAEEEEEMVVEE